MKKLKELARCLFFTSYPTLHAARTAQSIGRMYGYSTRIENCQFCKGWHMLERTKNDR